jgi:hypothetical protein
MHPAPSKPRPVRAAVASLLLVALFTTSLGGCGCGFDCNNGNNNNSGPAFIDLGFSADAPDRFKQVVIEVDSITLVRTGGDDVTIERFTIDELDVVDADTFQVDLRQYLGLNQLLVSRNLEASAQSYSSVRLEILDGDVNRSFVQEEDDSLKPVNLAGSALSLPGVSLTSGDGKVTITFGLAQALQFRESSDDYLLAGDGVRVQDNATSASLTGRVDSALFDTEPPCDAKEDPEAGNRVYLYDATALGTNEAGDVFTSDSENDIPQDTVAPFAVATLTEDTLTGNWQYALGFLPAGDYTLAFSCNAGDDDAVDYDGIEVPLPEDQISELTLQEGDSAVCDLTIDGSC